MYGLACIVLNRSYNSLRSSPSKILINSVEILSIDSLHSPSAIEIDMALTSSSNSSSTMSGSQSTPALNNNHSMDELYSLSSLQQVREKNLKLAELLLDSLRRNLEEKRRAQTEQKELTDAVQNSTELDTQAKESILRHLKTLKDQRGSQTMN